MYEKDVLLDLSILTQQWIFFWPRRQQWNFPEAMAAALTNKFKVMFLEIAVSGKSTDDGLVERVGESAGSTLYPVANATTWSMEPGTHQVHICVRNICVLTCWDWGCSSVNWERKLVPTRLKFRHGLFLEVLGIGSLAYLYALIMQAYFQGYLWLKLIFRPKQYQWHFFLSWTVFLEL